MPRLSYLECPHCKKRKAVEGRMMVSVKRLDGADVHVPVTDCTACRAKSIGGVVVDAPLVIDGRKRLGGGRVRTPEAREAITSAIDREAQRLRNRARYMVEEAERMENVARAHREPSDPTDPSSTPNGAPEMQDQEHSAKIKAWAHRIGGRTNDAAEMAAATLALRSALQRLRRTCGDDRTAFDRRVAYETENVR